MNRLYGKKETVKSNEAQWLKSEQFCESDPLAPLKTDFCCQAEFTFDERDEGFLFECNFNVNPEFHSQEVATQVRISRNCVFLYLKSDVLLDV